MTKRISPAGRSEDDATVQLLEGPLHQYLTHDHERLDALLAAAVRGDGSIDDAAYAEFRRGLLRHIGIEERILFPLLRSAVTEQLHRDHATLAALLVPPPTRAEVERIRAILAEHNPLEEGAGGFYEQVEGFVDMEKVRAFPEIPTAPYSDSPLLRQTIEKLLRDRG
jgi:hypothetical protein